MWGKVLWAPEGAAGNAGGSSSEGGAGAGGGGQTGGGTPPPAVSFTPEQQAHIDKVIAERLERDRKQRADEVKALADAAAKKAADDKLAAQAEFQKLAEQRATELDEEKAKREAAEKRAARMALKEAFRTAAAAAKASFANGQAFEDAFGCIEGAEGVALDDKGQAKGLEAALKALRSSRPYLFAASESGGYNIDAQAGRGTTPPDPKARDAELKQRYGIK